MKIQLRFKKGLLILFTIALVFSSAACNNKNSDSEILGSSPIVAESEPITVDECSKIFYENQEDFEAVKDYLISLPGDVYVSDPDSMQEDDICQEIKPYLSNLKESGIKSIKKKFYNEDSDSPYTRIDFYIDGTTSSKYGVSWMDVNQKFATYEESLLENWCSYFIGYT